MSVVFILVFVAILIASAFLIAFVWAVKSGQYDDTYTPSVRMLFDDPEIIEDKTVEDAKKTSSDEEKSIGH
ncbi:MAG: cbb3-type cytochrome oxidase assembly protein CcoS [Prolixibacteraceae bacterium]|jgi:cbb3-type cytochrome oxidase maturation protein